MLKTILIDDEQSSLSAMKMKLEQHCPNVKIVACCSNGVNGIEAINRLEPDLVFLDIEMPVMNGFLMLQHLRFKKFQLIFATAYEHFAIKAIRWSALDYLVKPIDINELKDAVQRAMLKTNQQHDALQVDLLLETLNNKKPEAGRIAIGTSEGMKFIPISSIIYLEASGNYTWFYLTNLQKQIVSKSLKEYEEILPPEMFFRIHNSYLINIRLMENYIKGDGGQVVMCNGVKLDVSKRKKTSFLKKIRY
jgi:two-component system LytT family response regulator